jgi:tetratricopeptide (TPR) repeat protein
VPQEEQIEEVGQGMGQAAIRLLRLGQVEEAARLAELTVVLLPRDPRGWAVLAEANLRRENVPAAIKALSRAKQLDPDNPGIWFAEGSLALRDGKPQAAIPLLRKGLDLEPANGGAYFDLGNAHLLLNEPRKALRAFERAAELRKSFWEAINNQALVLFELNERPEAIRRWRRVLTIKPMEAEPTLALAAGLYAQDPRDPGEALALAEAALDSDPNYVLDSYQKEQLWGEKLRRATRKLLDHPQLKESVERAMANATAASATDQVE